MWGWGADAYRSAVDGWLFGQGEDWVLGIELAAGDLLQFSAAKGAADGGESFKEIDAIEMVDLVLHNAGNEAISFDDALGH